MGKICCCPCLKKEDRHLSNDRPSGCAKAVRYVVAFLAAGVVLFGILGALAHHEKLTASGIHKFKQITAALHIDLISFAAVFISTGAAGLLACYFLKPKKAGTLFPPSEPQDNEERKQDLLLQPLPQNVRVDQGPAI